MSVIDSALNLFLDVFRTLFGFLNSLKFSMFGFTVSYGSILIATMIIVVCISIFYKGGRTS